MYTTKTQAAIDPQELDRYVKIYQENPDSRVFAPLADLYRRLGRLDEAELVCRDGISRHPYYAGGRVALAHVLLDMGRLNEALAEADHVVTYYPDNLLARKILVRVLGCIGQVDRARRELKALESMAPAMANDPEMERALQGPSSQRFLVVSPVKSRRSGRNSEVLNESGSSQKLKKLFRKKTILEAWIRRLDTHPSFRSSF